MLQLGELRELLFVDLQLQAFPLQLNGAGLGGGVVTQPELLASLSSLDAQGIKLENETASKFVFLCSSINHVLPQCARTLGFGQSEWAHRQH